MTCIRIPNGVVCISDTTGKAKVNGRWWHWEFHHYLGPSFTDKDGEPLRKSPPENHPVWQAFGEWFKKHRANCSKCKRDRERYAPLGMK